MKRMTPHQELEHLRSISPQGAAAYEAARRRTESDAEEEIAKSADSSGKALADSLAVAHRLQKSDSPSDRERGTRMRRDLELTALGARCR